MKSRLLYLLALLLGLPLALGAQESVPADSLCGSLELTLERQPAVGTLVADSLALSEKSAEAEPAQLDNLSPTPTDTLTVNQKRAMRGLTSMQSLFVPKGQWIFGGSASYSTHVNDSYNLLIVEGIDSEGYTFKISPMVGYAVADNMAVGVRFIYSRSLLNIDSGGLSLGDEDTGVSLTVDGYYVLKHSYEWAAVWRNYIPLGESKRFAIFIDGQLSAGGLQAKFAEGQPVRGTFETGYSMGVGVTPGLIAFATNNLAFEVSVGVLGISYSKVEQVHNQVTFGERTMSDLSFKINLLTIGLGVSFYL